MINLRSIGKFRKVDAAEFFKQVPKLRNTEQITIPEINLADESITALAVHGYFSTGYYLKDENCVLYSGDFPIYPRVAVISREPLI